MTGVDKFARTLLEEAKRFLEKGQQEPTVEGKQAYLHAALVLGFCSFEAHINSIADDFLVRKELTVIERSILAEKDYKLIEGEFALTDQLKMHRLTDRVEFLFRRFSGQPVNKLETWWCQLLRGLNSRNEVSHPKQHTVISEDLVEQALTSILDALDALYQAVYQKKYPQRKRGLDSTLSF
jgi:hypothetical protein